MKLKRAIFRLPKNSFPMFDFKAIRSEIVSEILGISNAQSLLVVGLLNLDYLFFQAA